MKLGQLETAALTVEFNTAPSAWLKEFYLFIYLFIIYSDKIQTGTNLILRHNNGATVYI